MNNEKIKQRYLEDCKKIGVEGFSFDDPNAPWRDLYIHLASKQKPGRTNSLERTSRVGVRIESAFRAGLPLKDIFNNLREEIKEMKESYEGIEKEFDHNFSNKSFINILENYRKLLKKAEESFNNLDYYDKRYKSTKVAKNHSE